MTARKLQPYYMPDDDYWDAPAEKKEKLYYPESDGQPMAETDLHRDLMVQMIESLDRHFAADKEVYVSGNLLLYYVEGDTSQCLAPDVFVVRGVSKRRRRFYKLWLEKHAPNIVLEISSRKTTKEDFTKKKQLYAWMGVPEYFIFDPEYKQKPPLRAFRLHGRDYVEEAVTGGRVKSHELGLELTNTGTTLRLFDPQAGQFLPTTAEESALRQYAETRASQAETRALQEANARQQAEAELARLRAELARLKKPKPNGRSR